MAISSAPVSGNRMIGNNDVTGIGIASVIHQIAIHAVQANTDWDSAFRSLDIGTNNMRINESGPAINEMIFLVELL